VEFEVEEPAAEKGLSGRGPAGARHGVLGQCVGLAAGSSEVSEDGGDDVGIEDEGEDAHFAAAAGAAQRVDLDALEKQSPTPTQGQQLRPGRRIRGTRAVRARARLGEQTVASPGGAPAGVIPPWRLGEGESAPQRSARSGRLQQASIAVAEWGKRIWRLLDSGF
jgi:hypothetical protein